MALELIAAGASLLSGAAKTAGGAMQRSAEREASERQSRFLKQDAQATMDLYRDRAKRMREQGESELSSQEAMIGKYGGEEQMGASLGAVQQKSEQNLDQDVKNLLAQGRQEADRLKFEADQASRQARQSRRMEPLTMGASILDSAMNAGRSYMNFGGGQ